MHLRPIKLAFVSCLAVAHAFPQPSSESANVGQEPKDHKFCPAKKTDSRAPCPGLNAMANHGYLRRTGRNITYPELRDAAQKAYNYTPDTYQIFFNLTTGLFNMSTTSTPTETFNLDDLKKHNTIEQDGSLSRNDIGVNDDDLHFDSTVWDPVAKDLGVTSDPHGYISNKTAAQAYVARQVAARKVNPMFNKDCFQRNGTQGTTALYLATLWDFEAHAVPKRWIEPFFVEERIPYKEGYTAAKPKNTDFIHDFFVTTNKLVNEVIDEVGGIEHFDPDTGEDKKCLDATP